MRLMPGYFAYGPAIAGNYVFYSSGHDMDDNTDFPIYEDSGLSRLFRAMAKRPIRR